MIQYGVTEVFVKHDYYSSLRVKLLKQNSEGNYVLLKIGEKGLEEVNEILTDKKIYTAPDNFLPFVNDFTLLYIYEEGEYSIPRYKYIKHEGSSRSSKSFSLEEKAIRLSEETPGFRITVWRDSRESLGNTIWKDFRKIFPLSGRFYKFPRNTVPIYFENNSVIEPHGGDTTNAHGITQDIAWLNEPYKMTKETFDQIDMRSEQIWIDINPSGRHWSDSLHVHPRCKVIHSTFLMNPFCPIDQKLKIMSYDPDNPINVANGTADKYMHEVYALGKKAEKPNRIFKNWQQNDYHQFKQLPFQSYYSTDFGLSAPTAVIEFKFDGDRTFFFHQHIYKPMNMMKGTLSDEFDALGFIKNKENICDSGNELNKSEGQKLKNSGYNMIFAQKGHGSVNAGIEMIQKYNIVYTKESSDLENEYENYSWRIYQGIQLDEPEDNQLDHLMDCCRMGVSWYAKTRYLS